MNDSTPDNSGATPEADAADMAPAAKKPAAKRAPRKKAAPVSAEVAEVVAVDSDAAAVSPTAEVFAEHSIPVEVPAGADLAVAAEPAAAGFQAPGLIGGAAGQQPVLVTVTAPVAWL